MNFPLSEELTTRFYKWEARGRGRHVFEFPVDLEPQFYPFFGHFVLKPQPIDDGKHPTLLSTIVDLFKNNKKPVENRYTAADDIPAVTALETIFENGLVAYSIVLPKDAKLEAEDMEHLLLMLSYTSKTLSFEIIATATTIKTQFVCHENDAANLHSQVKAYFPVAIITKDERRLDFLGDNLETCVIELGLAEEFMRPIAMIGQAEKDPFIGLFASLEHLQNEEQGTVQILFKGAINPWAESIMRSVTDNKGGSFFADAPEMVKLAQEKISSPLYAVCIRVVGQAEEASRAIEIAKNISITLTRVSKSKSNTLVILKQDDMEIDEMIGDVYLRQSHRLGMLLNSQELATIVHFPTPEIASPKVERDTKKTKCSPESALGHPFVLGKNIHHAKEQLVSVPTSLRLKHTHVIGATGTGKSTLLLSMIAQDMQLGNGLSVLDPHGDLIEAILAHVPKERINDVILINPADGEFPVAFNILSAHSEIEKDILSSDLVAAFKRLSTSWGDQMNSVLANAILAFLESKEGGTLLDLRRFLVEKSFRDTYLKTVADPHVVYYWQHEYPLLKSNSIGSILTRLDTFLRPKLIRNMVAQKKGLDFENILDTKKILLVKLSQGLIGAENSFLLGTFFVSKMYQTAMARQAKSKEERNDFFLYIDEFQNFITPSMSHILSGARKYHLGLILAHQDMQQLQKYDTELASSVVVNAGTRICFRLGDTDAKRFASGFSYFEAEDLENLSTGEAIARIEQPNSDFTLSTIPLPELEADSAEATMQAVIQHSRDAYGTPKSVVEESLEFWGKSIKEKVKEPLEAIQEVQKAEQVHTPFVPVEVPKHESLTKKTETEHRYLQTLVKRMAESRGYKAIIEDPTPDGKGRVDVSLERAGKRIACEVSVTTGDDWEVHNVEKCLTAGYDQIIVCSTDVKHLHRIKEQLGNKLNKDQQSKVLTLEPNEVIQFFDMQIIQENRTEKVIKGYRVKIEYDSTTNSEMAKKHGNVIKTVVASMKSTNKRRTE
ncbi:MAG: hypothetical protein BGO70_01120 [Bacteroidetes bacterium 43-93]|uniref:type IV secretory system conjugative DNA transfer family protein n=1 Tax=uncultured Dysgonomonas sp. TaxID=206096 RepID=UPI000926C1A9|nr:type IV secretion system DNA-binding domain-containing protein [uncultured Dysgonomonas sp.]MBN9483122.1 type IV secretion system DNA-binding domain-containing protein [Bacteroidota bacterium]OJW96313.1 MAG: hypothetical protein BGO70_01120 [Bacteroidetes bacterium 43-93]